MKDGRDGSFETRTSLQVFECGNLTVIECFKSTTRYLGSTNNFDRISETIIFPDQSPNQILNGYAKGSMPDEYTGGVGKEGVENLKKFVEAGGTLVFLNRSSDFAIEQFNLPIKDVTKGLPRKDFYIPGSILRTELDLTSRSPKVCRRNRSRGLRMGRCLK